MIQKNFKSLLIIFALSAIPQSWVTAQTIVRSDNNCESNSPFISNAATRVGNSNIIIIARLGKNETNQIYSQNRLQEVKKVLLRTELRENQIVLAYGERVKSKGRIELYVNGILDVIFEMPRNKNIKASDCDK